MNLVKFAIKYLVIQVYNQLTTNLKNSFISSTPIMESTVIGKRLAGSDPLKTLDARSLANRFRSKRDIFKYLSEQCNYNYFSLTFPSVQYYMPPARYMNKDFLKLVLKGQKCLIPLDQVRPVHMPRYDELSVVRLFKDVSKDQESNKFFSDTEAGGKLPPREYFFNVLNTIQPDYVKQILEHAQSLRFAAQSGEEDKETIEITEEWHAQLMALPFFSSTPGKTLMLLKKRSKPGRQGFKREVREVQTSLKRFRELGGRSRPLQGHSVGGAGIIRQGSQLPQRGKPSGLDSKMTEVSNK